MFFLEQYSEALEALQQSLKICRHIGSSLTEVEVCQSVGKVYQKIGNFKLAMKYCDRALNIATELGTPLAQDCKELKERLLNEQSGRNDSGNR